MEDDRFALRGRENPARSVTGAEGQREALHKSKELTGLPWAALEEHIETTTACTCGEAFSSVLVVSEALERETATARRGLTKLRSNPVPHRPTAVAVAHKPSAAEAADHTAVAVHRSLPKWRWISERANGLGAADAHLLGRVIPTTLLLLTPLLLRLTIALVLALLTVGLGRLCGLAVCEERRVNFGFPVVTSEGQAGTHILLLLHLRSIPGSTCARLVWW